MLHTFHNTTDGGFFHSFEGPGLSCGLDLVTMQVLLAHNEGADPALFGGIILIWALFVVSTLVLLIWALVDCIKNPNLSSTQRIIWVLIILFIGCIGPVLYLLVGRHPAPPPSQTD